MSSFFPNQAHGFQQDEEGWFIRAAPTDDRDYSIDWTLLLASLVGTPVDQITLSNWNVPVGVTLGAVSTNNPTNINTAWLTTPVAGTFFISNSIVTRDNRDFTRGFRLIVGAGL